MPSFLQSPAWETFQRHAGATVTRTDGSLFIKRELPLGGSYWQSSRFISPSFSIPAEANGAWFLRLEPEDAATHQTLVSFAAKRGLKLKPSLAIQPRQTSIVDISIPYEDALKNMKQKHRYNVKVAEKHGVAIASFSKDLKQPFARFWDLLQTTGERHGFRTHGREYYEKMLEALEPEGMAHVLLASHGDKDLAGMILITYGGTATYLHGGSTQERKELMAPYLLHAEAIKLAQSLGCTSYDLWGTHLVQKDGEWKPLEGHASAGVSRFKLGFGGQIIEYPGTFDLILKPFWYTPYQLGRKLLTGSRDFS